jgi:hypothetical protein
MTITYCDLEDVSQYYKNRFRRIDGDNNYVSLYGDSGSGQADKTKVKLTAANAAKFFPGANVRVFDDANFSGELGVVASITFNGDNSYLTLEDDMTDTHTTANNAAVQLRSFFNYDSEPDVSTIERMINDAEDEIDRKTHHAWRSTTVTREYHHRPRRRASIWPGTAISLHHRTITNFTSGTDKIEVYDGSDTSRTWTDWVATKTEGRDDDWWCDYEDGIIYLKAWYIRHETGAVRVTYRYGESTVPKDIRKCCAMMVAVELLTQEQHLNNMPAETGQGHTYELSGRIRRMQTEIDRIISKHTEMIVFHE